jgi:hypothetical protein
VNITYDDELDKSYAYLLVPSLGTSVKKYELNDKVKINGSTVSAYEASLKNTALSCSADMDEAQLVYGSTADSARATLYSQPVRVDISSDKIRGFITLSAESETNESTSKLVRYLPLSKYKYTASKNFNNEFYIDTSTIIIYVPGDRYDKDEYAKMTMSSLFKTGQSYWVEPYDVSTGKTASLIIVYGNSSMADITKDSAISIAAKTPSATELNDETIHRITMYTSDSVSTVTKNASDNKEFADLEVGDVFQFGYNNKSLMINKTYLIRAADVKAKLEQDDYDWTDSAFIYEFTNTDGTVEMDSDTNSVYHKTYVANVLEVSTDDDYIRVTSSDINDDGTSVSGTEERYSLPSNLKVIRFDTEKNSISNVVEDTSTKLSADDLRDAKYSGRECSKILIDVVKGEIKYIMIYE